VDGLRWIPPRVQNLVQKLDLKLELEREEIEKAPVVVVKAAEIGEGRSKRTVLTPGAS